jgi:Delta3-Delta2-enoyl-CoA isomerase
MTGTTDITTEIHDGVTVVRMDADANRFTPPFLDSLSDAITSAERRPGPSAIVLTGGGRTFSEGIDLEWAQATGREATDGLVVQMHALFLRLLTGPLTSVAAINGHAFGGGAMLALACDQRVMRADRGWFCLPEVDFRLEFTIGMTALIRRRLGDVRAHEAMLTGRRYGGTEAAELGIVDEAVGYDLVVERAVARARALADKDRAAVAAIKATLYADVAAALAA